MKSLQELITDITKLTVFIETHYPELYQFLNESPSTIPFSSHPDINIPIMKGYKESLKELLKHHIETHKN